MLKLDRPLGTSSKMSQVNGKIFPSVSSRILTSLLLFLHWRRSSGETHVMPTQSAKITMDMDVVPTIGLQDQFNVSSMYDDIIRQTCLYILNETTIPETGNITLADLLQKELETNPIRDSLSIAIPMTLIYSLILLSGLLGNISTCIVIARNSYMHTATNYYLFSLAMSDLLLLISGLPQEIYHIWIKYPYIFGEAFCVLRGLAAETSANATVLTITAFTVERFVAIVYPLKSHLLSQLSRVIRMIAVIWLLALCLALPQAAQFGLQDMRSQCDETQVLVKGAWCTLAREIFPYAFQISICVFFVIPMTLITVLYVLIGLKLRRSRKGPLNSHRGSQEINSEPRTQNRHSQSHVIRMLVAVVVGFFICWAPFHTQRLMALYGNAVGREGLSSLFLIIYKGITHISGILYYLSTCINPILYHIMSNKFRQAFKDTMRQVCGLTTSSSFPDRNHLSYRTASSRLVALPYRSNSRNNVLNSAAAAANINSNFSKQRSRNDLLATIEEKRSSVAVSEVSQQHNDLAVVTPPNANVGVSGPCTKIPKTYEKRKGLMSLFKKGGKLSPNPYKFDEIISGSDFTINVSDPIRASTEIVIPAFSDSRNSSTTPGRAVSLYESNSRKFY